MSNQYDPITLEIIQNSLQAAADEMFAALRRTAMSAIIYEVLDAGTGITDRHGEMAWTRTRPWWDAWAWPCRTVGTSPRRSLPLPATGG